MIKYALQCSEDHGFEGWFGSSDDYDAQSRGGLVQCPVCGDSRVRKQIMAPAVRGTKAQPRKESGSASLSPAQMQEMMTRLRSHVEDNFDYVGDQFAREARDIHEGVAEERGIYGEASPDEVRALVEDGIGVAPLPPPAPKPRQVN